MKRRSAFAPRRWSEACRPDGPWHGCNAERLGKSKKVLVIASGDKIREAQEASADYFGREEMVNKIQSEGWVGYDAMIATPDMMRSVGKLGEVLGPRGLMPNPKTGTIRVDVGKRFTRLKPVR